MFRFASAAGLPLDRRSLPMKLPLRLIVPLLIAGAAPLAAQTSEAPLPYAAEPAFDLKFEQPLGIVSPPGDRERLFILEKTGRILVIPNLAKPESRVFIDLTERMGDPDLEQGVLALAFHPDYRRNRFFYVWYTSCHKVDGQTVREDRLSRFTISADDPNRADPASEQRMISQPDRYNNHNGGEALFGPDGYLYVSLGDEGFTDDKLRNSQQIDANFFAGILRIDVDQRPGSLKPNPHPAVHAGTYTVPADNPFVGTKTFNGAPVDPAKVRTEFWAVGLRNPWRMAFDPATGRLWCADVGQRRYEEISLIERGGNYGWSYREGFHASDRGRTDPPAAANFKEPVWEYPHTEGLSITGGLVAHGKRYPDLQGKYLFADYVFGRVWALEPDGDKPVSADRVRRIAQVPSVASFGLDPRNGDVLMASLATGQILRLVAVPAK